MNIHDIATKGDLIELENRIEKRFNEKLDQLDQKFDEPQGWGQPFRRLKASDN